MSAPTNWPCRQPQAAPGETCNSSLCQYPQRSEYMAGKVTFEQFYRSVANVAGISYAHADILPRVKAALANGDLHLNTIGLAWWDSQAAMTKEAVSRALKLHGDRYSLAGSVCVHKQAAIIAAEEAP